jgi:hypothetical protein
LEELEAAFKGACLESVKEMKRITLSLKKLEIYSISSSDTVNALLKTLDNLESMRVWKAEIWEIPSGKVYPKIKRFSISSNFADKSRPECLVSVFPNLEFLWISTKSSSLATEPFFVELLNGLKQLKSLYITIDVDTTLDQESTLQCFQKYWSHLEEAEICVGEYNFYHGDPYDDSNCFRIDKELNKPYRLTDRKNISKGFL